MNWLIEDPTALILLVVFVQLILLVVFFRTGRVVMLGWIGALLVLLGLVFLVDYLVVTDREAVALVLDEMVAAAEANDDARLLATISPRADGLDEDARGLLARVEIDWLQIIVGPKVIVNELTSPASATAEFTIQGEGRLNAGAVGGMRGRHVQPFVIHFERDGDRWLATRSEPRWPYSR
ncbi:MAG: hypothetical protein DWQ31_11170 [Planctomycetota bacterium]|nr:MAG: hypothetical protein DWQ31_11170 [Planctomycetota bacterium]REJ94439.1 MAG: hypothetical protein DWQ35_08570 [Planctomycetota bacterium]REK22027.1 MAG: hypothetical protein DWQ42_17955 [Planctomycetota bacterium]REK44435.1 MAG: hypothetical protein DWQ46_09240 [Planctomycetota bacterium]